MATVSKSDRSTKITLASASAGPFALGFRLFDTDGLEVYVNELPRTDFTLSATFNDGFDDGAIIAFDASLGMGDIVLIDGNLVPDREDDYLDGPGLTAKFNIELARIASSLQELHRNAGRSLRFFSKTDPSTIEVGRTLVATATGIEAGPDVSDIADAQQNASDAINSANAAAVSETNAAASEVNVMAVEDNLPDWQGGWLTATFFETGDLFREDGSTYITLVDHTSGVFATDLASNKMELFAQKGAAGAGTGDMLAANDLSDVANVGTARSNLGLGTAATTAASAYATAAQGTKADAALPAPASPADGDIIIRSGGAWSRLAKGVNGQVLELVAGLPSWGSGGLFSESYTSAEQIITAGGPLTLPHGLSGIPRITNLFLICKVADVGYSIGDKVPIPHGDAGNTVRDGGTGIVLDATNINIRFNNTTPTFILSNFTTGSMSLSITNARWKLVVEAYY